MDEIATITVKGMVCSRCVDALRTALNKTGAKVREVYLGAVEVFRTPSFNAESVRETVACLGFELIVDRRERLVERVKELVNEVLSESRYASVRFSDLVSERTGSSYDTVSGIFSAKEGITIGHYIINRKIERVKRLLESTDRSLTDISYETSFSSVHHLSKQFKEKEGVNPTQYRLLFRSAAIASAPQAHAIIV